MGGSRHGINMRGVYHNDDSNGACKAPDQLIVDRNPAEIWVPIALWVQANCQSCGERKERSVPQHSHLGDIGVTLHFHYGLFHQRISKPRPNLGQCSLKTLLGEQYHCPHLQMEKTAVQRGNDLSKATTESWGRTRDRTQVSSPPLPVLLLPLDSCQCQWSSCRSNGNI